VITFANGYRQVLSSSKTRIALSWLVRFGFDPELEFTEGCIVLEIDGVEGLSVEIGRGKNVGSVAGGKGFGSEELGMFVDIAEGATEREGSESGNAVGVCMGLDDGKDDIPGKFVGVLLGPSVTEANDSNESGMFGSNICSTGTVGSKGTGSSGSLAWEAGIVASQDSKLVSSSSTTSSLLL
jgi:hypothetical protein